MGDVGSWFINAAVFFLPLVALVLTHPATPPGWNPVVPLSVSHEVSPLTHWKMRRALRSPEACLAAIDSADVTALAPLESENPSCGISARVRVSRVGAAAVEPVETTCAVALRLAMWERHAVQPASRDLLGQDVSQIRHLSSYSCRQIRTPSGSGGRMSTHATGEAIDITGFDLADGTRLRLIDDWDGETAERRFLRAARDGACEWFATTLGPDFNSLHADHFHLQSRGRGLCR